MGFKNSVASVNNAKNIKNYKLVAHTIIYTIKKLEGKMWNYWGSSDKSFMQPQIDHN